MPGACPGGSRRHVHDTRVLITGVQPLENYEDPDKKLGLDPDAVIPDRELAQLPIGFPVAWILGIVSDFEGDTFGSQMRGFSPEGFRDAV